MQRAPDTVLVNGKLVVYDGAPAQALAVRDGKIAAIGNSSDIRALAASSTRIIDLGGRTVIPGLIDSHIHAIRAGLTYTTELDWTGLRTLAEALERIRVAARSRPNSCPWRPSTELRMASRNQGSAPSRSASSARERTGVSPGNAPSEKASW